MAAALVLAPAAPAVPADETIATVALPAPVGAHAGRVVWSSFDEARRRYVLMTSFAGVVSALPVRPRSVPFDVDLGPSRGGATLAAYSRCGVDPPRRDPAIGNAIVQMPDWARGRRCDLFRFDFETGRESRIAGPSSVRGSEFLPSVWKGRVAFVRTYPRRHGIAGRRPYLYRRSIAARGASRRLPGGPRSTSRHCSGSPRRCKLLAEPGPTALDLAGRRLAFGWDSGGGGEPTSSLYLETIRLHSTSRRLVQRVSSGDIQGIELLSPAIESGRLHWGLTLYGDDTRNELRRYRISSGRTEQASLPPPAAQAQDRYRRPLLWTAVDGSSVIYLMSANALPPDEPCTTRSPCIIPPGCSPAERCAIRRAGNLVFTPLRR